jgi:hypothetical protein
MTKIVSVGKRMCAEKGIATHRISDLRFQGTCRRFQPPRLGPGGQGELEPQQKGLMLEKGGSEVPVMPHSVGQCRASEDGKRASTEGIHGDRVRGVCLGEESQHDAGPDSSAQGKAPDRAREMSERQDVAGRVRGGRTSCSGASTGP